MRLVTRHRRHPEFMVAKLWGYFIPTKPSPSTVKALSRLYVAKGREVRPLLEAILAHPDLYDAGRRMVKPPVVQAAGMLRAVGRGIDTNAWAWLCDSAGQYLFLPPNVVGLGRHALAGHRDVPRPLADGAVHLRARAAGPGRGAPDVPADPAGLVDAAIGFWGSPAISAPVRSGLEKYAADTLAAATERWEKTVFPVLALNALRMLVATSPDYLTS